MSAEVIPLTKALFEYYEREREPRFRPVNGTDEALRELQDDMAIQQIMDMTEEELAEDCRLRGTTVQAEADEVQRIFESAKAEVERRKLTSDNLRLTTIRPWRPEDDDGGNAA